MKPGHPSTFYSLNGESNIDVTFANGQAMSKLENWMVHPDAINSDHRLTFEVRLETKDETQHYGKTFFNLKAANWARFSERLDVHLTVLERETVWEPNIENLDRGTEGLTKAISKAMCETIPQIRPTISTNKWWSKQLQKLKK